MNPLMNSVGSNAEGKLNCINAVVITQKSYTVDFLTKKKKINEGEIPQYYVEGNHEAIISPEVFEQVQRELERRKSSNGRHTAVFTFSPAKSNAGNAASGMVQRYGIPTANTAG